MSKAILNKKLGRKRDARNMLVRNLVTSLILHERIKTTAIKAKILKSRIEKLVTLAKRSNKLMAKRFLARYLLDKNASKKVLEVLLPEFKDRKSGIVRTIKIGPRKGDSADMVYIELLLSKKIKEIKSKSIKLEKDNKEIPKGKDQKIKSGVKTTVKQKK